MQNLQAAGGGQGLSRLDGDARRRGGGRNNASSLEGGPIAQNHSTESQKRMDLLQSPLIGDTDENLDYDSKIYLSRILKESAQKKTSFRQLKNADQEKLRENLMIKQKLQRDSTEVLREGAKNAQVRSSSELKMNVTEHELGLDVQGFKKEHDIVKIPQKKYMAQDLIMGVKTEYEVPDVELIPDSKYREAYINLLTSQKKAFNKKSSNKQFHETLNIKGMHQKQYLKDQYTNVKDFRRTMGSQQSLKSSIEYDLHQNSSHGASLLNLSQHTPNVRQVAGSKNGSPSPGKKFVSTQKKLHTQDSDADELQVTAIDERSEQQRQSQMVFAAKANRDQGNSVLVLPQLTEEHNKIIQIKKAQIEGVAVDKNQFSQRSLGDISSDYENPGQAFRNKLGKIDRMQEQLMVTSQIQSISAFAQNQQSTKRLGGTVKASHAPSKSLYAKNLNESQKNIQSNLISVDATKKRMGLGGFTNSALDHSLSFIKRNLDKEASDVTKMRIEAAQKVAQSKFGHNSSLGHRGTQMMNESQMSSLSLMKSGNQNQKGRMRNSTSLYYFSTDKQGAAAFPQLNSHTSYNVTPDGTVFQDAQLRARDLRNTSMQIGPRGVLPQLSRSKLHSKNMNYQVEKLRRNTYSRSALASGQDEKPTIDEAIMRNSQARMMLNLDKDPSAFAYSTADERAFVENREIFKDINVFENKNLSVQQRMAQQISAAKEFEHFYNEQKKIQELKARLREQEMMAFFQERGQEMEEAQRKGSRDDKIEGLRSTMAAKTNLQNDIHAQMSKPMTRKVSPPGRDGIESITALGNAQASPVSNFYCRGYRADQKYWIDQVDDLKKNLEKRKQLSHLRERPTISYQNQQIDKQIRQLGAQRPVKKNDSHSQAGIEAYQQFMRGGDVIPAASKRQHDQDGFPVYVTADYNKKIGDIKTKQNMIGRTAKDLSLYHEGSYGEKMLSMKGLTVAVRTNTSPSKVMDDHAPVSAHPLTQAQKKPDFITRIDFMDGSPSKKKQRKPFGKNSLVYQQSEDTALSPEPGNKSFSHKKKKTISFAN